MTHLSRRIRFHYQFHPSRISREPKSTLTRRPPSPGLPHRKLCLIADLAKAHKYKHIRRGFLNSKRMRDIRVTPPLLWKTAQPPYDNTNDDPTRLRRRWERTCVVGEHQAFKPKEGRYIRVNTRSSPPGPPSHSSRKVREILTKDPCSGATRFTPRVQVSDLNVAYDPIV